MNKKVQFTLILCVSLSLIYIFISAQPLQKSLHIAPQWTIDISRPLPFPYEGEKDANNAAIPFKLAQTIGYFTEDGTMLQDSTFDYKATIAHNYYATYSTNSSPIPFYNSDGTLAGKIEQTGFPFFTDDGLYLFLPGGSSFAKLESDGSIAWTYENYAPITAFSTSAFGCVAGFADGKVVSFTNDGTIDQQFEPAGSNYPVILGVALSDSGNFVACLCGQDRQRFVLARKHNAHTEILYHEYLEDEVTRQVLLMFDKSEKNVYYDYAGGLGIVNTKMLKNDHLALPGKILSLKEAENMIFALSREGETCTVSIIQPFACHAGSFSFKAAHAFIAVKDNKLFVGRDGSISRMDIAEK